MLYKFIHSLGGRFCYRPLGAASIKTRNWPPHFAVSVRSVLLPYSWPLDTTVWSVVLSASILKSVVQEALSSYLSNPRFLQQFLLLLLLATLPSPFEYRRYYPYECINPLCHNPKATVRYVTWSTLPLPVCDRCSILAGLDTVPLAPPASRT